MTWTHKKSESPGPAMRNNNSAKKKKLKFRRDCIGLGGVVVVQK